MGVATDLASEKHIPRASMQAITRWTTAGTEPLHVTTLGFTLETAILA